MWALRDIIIAALIAGALPIALINPFFGLLAWCWLSYMVPHKLAWGALQNYPVAAVLGGVLLVGYFFSKEPKQLPMNRITITLILFILWMCLTTLMAPKPIDAWPRLELVLKIQLITFVTLMMVKTPHRLHLLVAVIALSLSFYGLKGGRFTLLQDGEWRVWGPSGSFFGDNNDLAIALLMIIPLLRYVQLQTTTVWVRRTLFALLCICVFAVLGTYSRAAYVASFCMITFLWLKGRKKVFFGLSIIFLLPIGLGFMPEAWHQRMDSIFVGGEEDLDESIKGRINAWWMNYNLAKSNFFGGGFAATNPYNFFLYAPDPNNIRAPHSIYFQILGQHGFVGLALFLLLGWFVWQEANRVYHETKGRKEMRWARDLAHMLQVSFIAYAVGGAFLGLAYFDLFYHLIALVVVLRVVVERTMTLEQPLYKHARMLATRREFTPVFARTEK